jgi:hypothetical protein
VRRRALALIGLGAVLVACGCGGGEEAGGTAARPAAPPSAPSAPPDLGPYPKVKTTSSVRRQLDGGAVGVIDLRLRTAIAPDSLQLNREQEALELEWTGWGTPHAMARGKVRTLICDPTCAQGRLAQAPGTVELSDIRVCGERRYYASAKLATSDPEVSIVKNPATFLRTPC